MFVPHNNGNDNDNINNILRFLSKSNRSVGYENCLLLFQVEDLFEQLEMFLALFFKFIFLDFSLSLHPPLLSTQTTRPSPDLTVGGYPQTQRQVEMRSSLARRWCRDSDYGVLCLSCFRSRRCLLLRFLRLETVF